MDQKNGITITKGDQSLFFDLKFGTPKGYIFGITMHPEDRAEMAQVTLEKNYNYMTAHGLLGHPGRDLLLGTVERLSWNLSEKKERVCEDCMTGKAKRMDVNKEAKNRSNVPGERLMIDISSVKTTEQNRKGRKFWLLVVDEASNMKWSFFLRSKAAQVPVMMGFIKGLREQNKLVKFIRCDNAGENLSLKKKIDEDGFNIKFEFTARETPQQMEKLKELLQLFMGECEL